MSINFVTYIAFDDDTPADLPVFSHKPCIWSFSDDDSLVTCGQRQLFAALGYDPDNAYPTPLYKLRGIPNFVYHSSYVYRYIEDEENVGWLDVNEFESALLHSSIDRTQLKKSVQRLLHTMDYLSGIFGKERVRILFVFIH